MIANVPSLCGNALPYDEPDTDSADTETPLIQSLGTPDSSVTLPVMVPVPAAFAATGAWVPSSRAAKSVKMTASARATRGRPTVDRVVMEFPLAHGRASPRFASLGKLSECGMRFLILHNAG